MVPISIKPKPMLEKSSTSSAFLSKPGQTLAPVLGSYLLYKQTGKSIFLNKSEDKTVYETSSEFSQGCFVVMVMVSIFCGLLQVIVWKFFTLKDKYLHQVKTDRYYMEKVTTVM